MDAALFFAGDSIQSRAISTSRLSYGPVTSINATPLLENELVIGSVHKEVLQKLDLVVFRNRQLQDNLAWKDDSIARIEDRLARTEDRLAKSETDLAQAEAQLALRKIHLQLLDPR